MEIAQPKLIKVIDDVAMHFFKLLLRVIEGF